MRTSSLLVVLTATLLACKPKTADVVEGACSEDCKAEAQVSPRDGAENVALSGTLTVELSEEAEVLLTLRGPGGVVLESTDGVGDVTLSLDGLVEANTDYVVEVRHACVPGSDALCSVFSTSFSTRDPDDTPTVDTGTGDDDDDDDDVGDDDDDDDVTTDTGDTGLPPVPGTPLGDAPTLSAAALADIAADIDAVRNGTSYTSGIYVVDADNGQVVYAADADTPYKPASNMKLFTTGVAFAQLGEEHRFRTQAWVNAAPNGSGAVSSLTVVVEHDFTWSSYFYSDAYFPVDRLVEKLYDEGLRSVTGQVTLSGETVFDGTSLGYFDTAADRAVALSALMSSLELYGITVSGGSTTSSSFTPPQGLMLAERLSPPLHVADHPVNVSSHNEFADLQLRHDGYELWGGSSYAEGEAAVLDWLDGEGVDTSDLAFYDGSGLSHSNRVTARAVVDLQQALYNGPAGTSFERTLSTAAVDGTLGGRMFGADTAGRFHGKTGTLYDTIATSGILHHAHDGHRYLISVLFNNVGYQPAARGYCDDIVEAVARDHRNSGTRPNAPTLNWAKNAGGGRVDLSWDSAASANSYGVWVSTNGAWRRSDALVETGTTTTISGLPVGPVAFRLTAINGQGESEPSDTYAVATSSDDSRILLVDGNDRWDGQSENTWGEGHDSLHIVGRAISGRPFDSADNDAVIDGSVDLDDYDVVLWLLGEESTADESFNATEQSLVEDFATAGHGLLVSGAEVGWDLDSEGDATDQAFYNNVLKASYAGDDAGTYTVVPRSGGLFSAQGDLEFYTPGTMNINYPDLLTPINGAVSELDYWGGTLGTAGLSYDGPYKLVHLGFPLESIDALESREALIEQSLVFFGL